MAVISQRRHSIDFNGDGITQTVVSPAANNATSPAKTDLVNLASGANTITPPTGATAVTLLPPSGNLISISLRGIAGDAGIALHLTDPTTIALAGSSTFVLLTGGIINNFRMIWS